MNSASSQSALYTPMMDDTASSRYQYIVEKHIAPLKKFSERLGHIVTIMQILIWKNRFLYSYYGLYIERLKEQSSQLEQFLEKTISTLKKDCNRGRADEFIDNCSHADRLFRSHDNYHDQDSILYAFGLFQIVYSLLQTKDFKFDQKMHLFPLICRYIFPAIKMIVEAVEKWDRSQKEESSPYKKIQLIWFYKNLKLYLKNIYNLIKYLDEYAMAEMVNDIEAALLKYLAVYKVSSLTLKNLLDLFDNDISESILMFIQRRRRPRDLSDNISHIFSVWLHQQTVDTIIRLWIDLQLPLSFNKKEISELLNIKVTDLRGLKKMMEINPLLYAFFPKEWLENPLFRIGLEDAKQEYEKRLQEIFGFEKSSQRRVEFEKNPHIFMSKRDFSNLLETSSPEIIGEYIKIHPHAIQFYRGSASPILFSMAVAGHFSAICFIPCELNADHYAHLHQRCLEDNSQELRLLEERTPRAAHTLMTRFGRFLVEGQLYSLTTEALSPHAAAMGCLEELTRSAAAESAPARPRA